MDNSAIAPLPSDSSNPFDFPKEFEHIAEGMYQKNLELNERNKTLALLRKIDEIILSTVTDPQQIAQQVANIVVSELGFKVVVVLLLDKKENVLVRLAISQTEAIKQAEQEFNKSFHGLKTSLTQDSNLIVQAVKERVMKVTHDLFDILTPHFTKEETEKIQEILGVKAALAYPLIVRGEVIGAMSVSVGQTEDRLSPYERDLISRLSGVIGIAMDNALMYQEIQEANEKLKVLDKLKDEFLSLATHELRTPMTAIKSYLWMLMNKGKTLDEEKKKLYMNRVYTSTQRLLNLVNELLDVSRIESGRLKLTPTSFDLLGLTKEVNDELVARVADRKQTLTIQDTPIPQIYADKDKIHEVLLNLIGNSIKYTPEEGKITVNFGQKDGMVQVSIIDTGRGISKEDMSKLFTKFGRLDNTLVAIGETGGTGLGLYICKQLVELSGGKIWVESEVGKGSTFAFTIPVYNGQKVDETIQVGLSSKPTNGETNAR